MEYYPAIKNKMVLLHTTHGGTLKTLYHMYKISRIDKSIKIKHRLVVA